MLGSLRPLHWACGGGESRPAHSPVARTGRHARAPGVSALRDRRAVSTLDRRTDRALIRDLSALGAAMTAPRSVQTFWPTLTCGLGTRSRRKLIVRIAT
jgi:hypothetical protein